MKVLIVHEIYYPNFTGGGEVIVEKLIIGLKQMGHKVTLITTGKQKDTDSVKYLHINRFMMILGLPTIFNTLKNYDIVICTTYNAAIPTYIASRIQGKPAALLALAVFGKQWIKIRGKFLGTLLKYIEKLILILNYNNIIALSDFSKSNLITMGINSQKITVANPGLEWKINSKYTRNRKIQILFTGRLDKQKGIRYIVEAAQKLPTINFTVVGKGKLEYYLKSNAPKNVKILGFVDRDKLQKIYLDAQIYCLPSEAETFGLTILEAMACGCAVISTVPLNFRGIHLKQPNNLAKSIQTLISKPSEMKKMGLKNFQLAKKYTWDNFTARIENVLSDIINQ